MSKPQPAPEVLLSHDARRPTRIAFTATFAAGCLTAMVSVSACLSAGSGNTSTSDVMLGSETGTSGDSGDSSTQPGIMTTTEEPEGSSAPSSGSSGSSGAVETTMPDPNCGNGSIDPGEDCDEGPDNADAGTCTTHCKSPVCGDGFVQSGEVCDDGVNDGSYGGCEEDCSARAPYCGDGNIDQLESCDGGAGWNVADGCLPNCSMAGSCLQIRDAYPDDAVVDGVYTIQRAEQLPFEVYCDMDADGGGYTFLKVAIPEDQPKLNAEAAEAVCVAFGMKLLAPRTQAHLAAATVAAKSTLDPRGGGDLASNIDYLSILGIYPVVPGKSCVGKPFNSADCPEWKTADDGPFWVSVVPVPGEPDTSNCAGCSMFYTWTEGGVLESYEASSNGGEGASWRRFMCDIGDKLGA